MIESSPLNFRRVVIWIGRLVLGGIFIYAGYAKLVMPMLPATASWGTTLSYLFMQHRPPLGLAISLFAFQVNSYQLLSPSGVRFVAHTLPFAEIALGLLLVIGWQLRIWATIVTLIILGFFGAVVRSYAMGLEINCGCFATPEPLTIKTVIRDGIFAALALAMTIFAFIEARKPHPWSARENA